MATQAKMKKTEYAVATTSDEEPAVQENVSRRPRKAPTSAVMLQRILITQEQLNAAIVRVEERLATMMDATNQARNNPPLEIPGSYDNHYDINKFLGKSGNPPSLSDQVDCPKFLSLAELMVVSDSKMVILNTNKTFV